MTEPEIDQTTPGSYCGVCHFYFEDEETEPIWSIYSVSVPCQGSAQKALKLLVEIIPRI